MKVMFVEAKRKLDADINDISLTSLPGKVFLAYSIQYKKLAEKLKNKLGKRIAGFKQVLGCSRLKSKYPILLIGSGKFHAIQLALQGNKVYILEGNKIKELKEKEIKKIKDKRRTALMKFLSAEKIGILVSCKPGQENLKKALILKKKLEKKGKKAKIFLSDSINLDELENYDIESWLNTACPALSFDSRILNMHEII
jgi:2-(3-amino-3-carboxypropyl)histidine synthase